METTHLLREKRRKGFELANITLIEGEKELLYPLVRGPIERI
jgi:hypothetical protein